MAAQALHVPHEGLESVVQVDQQPLLGGRLAGVGVEATQGSEEDPRSNISGDHLGDGFQALAQVALRVGGWSPVTLGDLGQGLGVVQRNQRGLPQELLFRSAPGLGERGP